MIRFEDLRRDIRRLRAERWATILAAEPPGRLPGRRPRDPETERLLTQLDRARLATLGRRGIEIRWPSR